MKGATLRAALATLKTHVYCVLLLAAMSEPVQTSPSAEPIDLPTVLSDLVARLSLIEKRLGPFREEGAEASVTVEEEQPAGQSSIPAPGVPAAGGKRASPFSPAASSAATIEQVVLGLSEDFAEWLEALPYVDHFLYQPSLRPGFKAVLPEPTAPSEPHIFHFEDAVTRYLEGKKMREALEEYHILVSYGYFLACCNQAQKRAVSALRAEGLLHYAEVLGACLKTSEEIEASLSDRVAYIRLAKSGPSALQDAQATAAFQRLRFRPHPGALGSARYVDFISSFESEFARQTILQAAKASAKKPSASAGPTPSAAAGTEKGEGSGSKKTGGGGGGKKTTA